MELTLPGKLHKALEREAQDAKRTLHAHLVRKLENVTPPIDTIDPRPLHANLPRLTAYLDRVPGVRVLSSKSPRRLLVGQAHHRHRQSAGMARGAGTGLRAE